MSQSKFETELEHKAYGHACSIEGGHLDQEAFKAGANWARSYTLQKDAAVLGLMEALKHADAAMTYAFDDYGDQYYNNVNEIIQKALKNFTEAAGEP